MSKSSFLKIDVTASINSGQVFLWKKIDNFWYGINGDNIIRIDSESAKIKSIKKKHDFFRNSDNIDFIIKKISRDKTIKSAIRKCPGLRILRQDPFQCYISFIVSSNSNIQNIKLTLNRLCAKFGEEFQYDKKEFFLFPRPEKLADASIEELKKCGLGYRAKFVKTASKHVIDDGICFKQLKKMEYYEAKNRLTDIFGIGNKVADCILLFSLEKLNAFPLDRWMLRILEKYYPDKFSINGKSLTEKKYTELHDKIEDYFGEYAGYAQQFLFKMERDAYEKKWL